MPGLCANLIIALQALTELRVWVFHPAVRARTMSTPAHDLHHSCFELHSYWRYGCLHLALNAVKSGSSFWKNPWMPTWISWQCQFMVMLQQLIRVCWYDRKTGPLWLARKCALCLWIERRRFINLDCFWEEAVLIYQSRENKDRSGWLCITKQDANWSLGFITKRKQFAGWRKGRCSNMQAFRSQIK